MDSSALAAVLAFLAAYLVIILVIYIVLIIANWKIFTKAGEAGWKSIIPIYNTYILYKISWETKMFWISLATAFLGSLITGMGSENTFLVILGSICSIASIVISIICTHKLSKSFGHGVGFTLGLIFLSPIFTMILAFGSSQYIGPDGVSSTTNVAE